MSAKQCLSASRKLVPHTTKRALLKLISAVKQWVNCSFKLRTGWFHRTQFWILLGTQRAVELISPAGALVGNLHVGALDDTLDVSGQIFALQVHTQRVSGEERNE